MRPAGVGVGVGAGVIGLAGVLYSLSFLQACLLRGNRPQTRLFLQKSFALHTNYSRMLLISEESDGRQVTPTMALGNRRAKNRAQ